MTEPHDQADTSNAPEGDGGRPFTEPGHVIVRLAPARITDTSDLRVLAREGGLLELARFLETRSDLTPKRVIRHSAPDQIRARERIARRGSHPPLASLADFWRIDLRHDRQAEATRSTLHQLTGVDIAYHETEVREAMPDFPLLGNNPYEPFQHYLKAAPEGIGAIAVLQSVAANSVGVRVIDLERAWILDHQDLPTLALKYGDDATGTDDLDGDHGAAALGVVGAIDNAIGVLGAAPKLTRLDVVSHFDAGDGTSMHVADAIIAATTHLEPGDILLLEVQRQQGGQLLPTEIDNADLNAIRQAVDSGVVVIEPAGNGKLDLDTWQDPTGQHALDRSASDFIDSGAIVVGASRKNVGQDSGGKGHKRYDTSNYGSRVDVYAWGERIFTCGYGDLAGSEGAADSYTSNFGQTSGAAAIIAGAAALLQSWHKAVTGEALTPLAMRKALADPMSGTRQIDVQTDGPIGVMPNLQSVVERGVAPVARLKRLLRAARIVPASPRDRYVAFRTRQE